MTIRVLLVDDQPLLRTGFRLILEAERLSLRAIERSEHCATRPREISSRSAKLKVRGERRRAPGEIPPVRSSSARTRVPERASACAILQIGSPARHRTQICARSAALIYGRIILVIQHPSLHGLSVASTS